MRKQNHFRRFAAALLTIIMISTLCSPALAARDDADKGIDLKIAVMSDTHYLAFARRYLFILPKIQI